MKKQVVVIHGGDTFDSYEEYLEFLGNFDVDLSYVQKKKWKKALQENLGDEFDVVALEMPNKFNAKYHEWKIWFEKFIPFLNGGVVLVGHSLGGIFLAKFLSENDFPKRITAAILIAPPFDDQDSKYSLADFNFSESLEKLEDQTGKVIIYFSEDDPVVPFADADKYNDALPSAQLRIFEGRGHFSGEEFPEIVEEIKGLFGKVVR